jgi:RHS repeat-associated protein
LQQVSGGVTTRYVLDINNDLAQVLSDGSNTYLYGLNRIAQQNIVGRQYYLGDAPGSVRQLVNPVGAVTLARSYEPFGKLLSTAGNPLTRYGYTGEWTDPTNLIYLRARYYDPATGRFLSKDPVRSILTRTPQIIQSATPIPAGNT